MALILRGEEGYTPFKLNKFEAGITFISLYG